MQSNFEWLSPLGIRVILFSIIGALWILIGVLAVPLSNNVRDPRYIIVSNRTDKIYFGGEPAELLKSNKPLSLLLKHFIAVISGFLVVSGTLVVALAIFGLKEGNTWSLDALGIGCISAIGFWAIALSPYLKAGIKLTLADIPPLMWVPAILILPALVLSWIGLK